MCRLIHHHFAPHWRRYESHHMSRAVQCRNMSTMENRKCGNYSESRQRQDGSHKQRQLTRRFFQVQEIYFPSRRQGLMDCGETAISITIKEPKKQQGTDSQVGRRVQPLDEFYKTGTCDFDGKAYQEHWLFQLHEWQLTKRNWFWK